MTTENFVYYDGFVRGETGLHSSWLDGYRLWRGILIYTGTWTGKNVMRYIDGTVGPRPGLSKIAVTGLPNGVPWGFGATDVPGADCWVVLGTTVYGFSSTGGAAFTYTGALAATPTAPIAWVKANTGVYITSQGDKTYFLDPVGKTCAAVTNAPGGRCITIYNDRLVVGNTGGTNPGDQIQYSNAYAPGNANPNKYPFPAVANFINVGDDWQVTALLPQRTHLAIAKQNQWWILTGTLGVNDAERKVLMVDGPLETQHVAALANGTIHYVPIFRDVPTAFNGSMVQELHNLRFANSTYVQNPNPPAFGVTRTQRPEDVLYLAGDKNTGGQNMAAFLHNGAWGYHSFGVPTSGFLADGGNNGGVGVAYLCDGGGAGVPPTIYAWPHSLDRPVVSGDTFGSFGDNSTTMPVANFTLPEWESRDGSEVTVRKLLVAFNKWNTGSTQTNHFDVTVESWRQWNKADKQTSNTYSFDEAPSVTPSNPTSHHKVISLGEQMHGNGFRINFSNLRGVAIAKVQAIVELSKPQV